MTDREQTRRDAPKPWHTKTSLTPREIQGGSRDREQTRRELDVPCQEPERSALVDGREQTRAGRGMRLAYADPPYPGKAHLYPENTEVDHAALIEQLQEYDGWALSTDEVNLAYVLSLCPPRTRVLAWCKTDAPPYHRPYPYASWEPVLCRPARTTTAVRSFFAGPMPAKGFCGNGSHITGAKSEGFCEWVIRCLGAEPDDDLTDLFPGTGVMGVVWERFRRQLPLIIEVEAEGIAARSNRLRRSNEQLPGMPNPAVSRERVVWEQE